MPQLWLQPRHFFPREWIIWALLPQSSKLQLPPRGRVPRAVPFTPQPEREPTVLSQGKKTQVTLGRECFPFFGSQRCQRKQSDVERPEKNSFLADVAHVQRGHLESYQWLKNKCSVEAAIQRYPVSESCEGCKQEETGMTFPPPIPIPTFFFPLFHAPGSKSLKFLHPSDCASLK